MISKINTGISINIPSRTANKKPLIKQEINSINAPYAEINNAFRVFETNARQKIKPKNQGDKIIRFE